MPSPHAAPAGRPDPSRPSACAFIFAGGGTGGHLYPGLAIAERLRITRGDDAACSFLCSDRPIDAAILSAEGVRFTPLTAKPAGLRPAAMLRFVRSWSAAVRTARERIHAERDAAAGRAVVVAMGGFVAAPAVRAARSLGVPVALINLDAVPGKANRLIARWADARLTAAGGDAPAAWRRIPPIVRGAALPPGDAATCRARLGLAPDVPTLTITGGSQGAHTINRAVIAVLDADPTLLRGWQVFHQCGDRGEADVREAYARVGARAVVTQFHQRMGEVWGAADIAISRAGAGSVAEAWASAVPTIFLPYPYHRDLHQRRNAEPLRSCGGAIVLTDRIEPTLNAADLAPALRRMVSDPAERSRMRSALHGLGPADGAEQAARAILALG